MRKSFCLILFTTTSLAQARAGEVTEEEFLAPLGAEHVAVRELGAELARAEAIRRRAGTLENPRLDFSREHPDGNPAVSDWTLSWTPPLDGRFGLGKKAADAGLAVARNELAAATALVRREMRRAFAEWSVAHGRSMLLGLLVERVSALAEHERQRARVGAGSGLAARRLLLSKAEARAALAEARASVARAEAEARAWSQDLPADARPQLPLLPDPPAALDPAEAPGVRSAEHRLEHAHLQARLAGRFWGFPTVQVGFQRVEMAGVVQSGPIVGAGWSIPLFDRNQGERAEARQRAEIATARLKRARALTAAEVRGGLDAYRTLWKAAREASLASAEADGVIDAATAAYLAGEATLTDLLDALRSASDARLRELDLRALAHSAHRDLEAASGRPLSLTKGESR